LTVHLEHMRGLVLLCFASPTTNAVEVRTWVNTSCIWVVSVLGRSARLRRLWLCQEVWRDSQSPAEVEDCDEGRQRKRDIREPREERGEEGLLLSFWSPGSRERLGEGDGRAGHLTGCACLNLVCSAWQWGTVAVYFSFFSLWMRTSLSCCLCRETHTRWFEISYCW